MYIYICENKHVYIYIYIYTHIEIYKDYSLGPPALLAPIGAFAPCRARLCAQSRSFSICLALKVSF